MPIEAADSVTTPSSESLSSHAMPTLGGGELLNMGVSVVIVVGVILLLGWFYSKSRVLNSSGSDIISVVASRALGPKERLMVVEVADQQLLLGMTTTGVRTLHVFDKPIALPQTPTSNPGFASRFRAALAEMRQ